MSHHKYNRIIFNSVKQFGFENTLKALIERLETKSLNRIENNKKCETRILASLKKALDEYRNDYVE